MLNRCVCLIAASGRRRASRLARSTKCRAMWTAHASSPDSFRLIDLWFTIRMIWLMSGSACICVDVCKMFGYTHW
jgi:hypothetical protein